MAETTLTVKQIQDLGLWEKVCDYKGWDYYILSEGKIDSDDLVTFDSEFKKEESAITEAHELAEFLHSKLCTDNHTDACGWYYAKDNWSEYAHEKYLGKANEMLKSGLEIDDIKNIITIAKKI